MQIKRETNGAILFQFPRVELKVALSILKAIYTVSKVSFIKECIDDLEIELRPRLTLVSHFHYCKKCVGEINDCVGDNFIHYTNDDQDHWRHRVCPPLKPNRP